jgi:hypothetical protein
MVACAGGIAAILIIVLLWRQSDMADELAALRARLDALSQPPPRSAVAVAEPISPSFTPEISEPRLTAGGEFTSNEDRIADLERVANGQADAIEELLDKLKGMDLSQKRAAAPAWNALQAVGPPDSAAGDQRTAWAPATEDGGEEWLQVDFEHAV